MERKHQAEWLELRTEAAEILRRGFPEQRRDRRAFQLVVLPSFEESCCWELYEREIRKDKIETIAINAIWHMQEDLTKFTPLSRIRHPRKLSPTITVKTGRINQSVAAKLAGELSEIAVSLLPYTGGISLDGTGYELTIGSGSTFSRVVWHDDGPQPWNPLRSWALRMASELENALLAPRP